MKGKNVLDEKNVIQSQEQILAMIKKIKEDAGMPHSDDRRAPQYAHDQLDAMLSAKAHMLRADDIVTYGAPGWAHALLDLIWDLF